MYVNEHSQTRCLIFKAVFESISLSVSHKHTHTTHLCIVQNVKWTLAGSYYVSTQIRMCGASLRLIKTSDSRLQSKTASKCNKYMVTRSSEHSAASETTWRFQGPWDVIYRIAPAYGSQQMTLGSTLPSTQSPVTFFFTRTHCCELHGNVDRPPSPPCLHFWDQPPTINLLPWTLGDTRQIIGL